MIVKNIQYSKNFIKELKRLLKAIGTLAMRREQIFKHNPLHPSLRLHELHGKLSGVWSMSISGGYRIIFERMENGDIVFISIGKHDVYRSL